MYVSLEGGSSKVLLEYIQSIVKVQVYIVRIELSLLSLKNVNKHGHQ